MFEALNFSEILTFHLAVDSIKLLTFFLQNLGLPIAMSRCTFKDSQTLMFTINFSNLFKHADVFSDVSNISISSTSD